MKSTKPRRTASSVLLIILSVARWGFGSEQVSFDKHAIINAVTGVLEERYVLPDVGQRMADHLRAKMDRGEYDEITNLDSFANQLTMDLRDISEDGHIVVYEFEPDSSSATLADELSKQDIAKHARENFGFVKAERLAGNVGYLKFDYFDYPEIAGPTATAAMNFVANCDAVIIDLRDNRGGKKDMVQFLASYFFREPIHFLTVFDRNNGVLAETTSLASVPGQRMFVTPLYILTSRLTASAGEAFTYNFKSFDRAVIVGETTKGIANWVEPVDFPEHSLRLHLPYARPESVVTHTNWERVGVKPNIEVPSDEALAVAHLEAMKKLINECPDEDLRRVLEWDFVEVQAQAKPIEWTREEMSAYTGVYGDGTYTVVIKDGRLCWKFSADEDHFLLPLDADLFVLSDDYDVRFQIYRNQNGNVSAFQLKYRDGYKGRIWPRTGNLP